MLSPAVMALHFAMRLCKKCSNSCDLLAANQQIEHQCYHDNGATQDEGTYDAHCARAHRLLLLRHQGCMVGQARLTCNDTEYTINTRLTTATWCFRNPFSQWHRSFQMAKRLATASCRSSNTVPYGGTRSSIMWRQHQTQPTPSQLTAVYKLLDSYHSSAVRVPTGHKRWNFQTFSWLFPDQLPIFTDLLQYENMIFWPSRKITWVIQMEK